MYSFLLIGQSNMAGRGFINEVEPIVNKNLFVLRNGCWRNMYVPVNGDRKFSGICLAESFADACSKAYNSDIGLIACADGGTNLEQWQPGGLLYDHAVYQAMLAMRTSTLAGVLWHQGESDCEEEKYTLYEKKCSFVFESLKKDLGIENIPFLVGGLGDFLINRLDIPCFKNYVYINQALKNMAEKNKYIEYVSAEGLTANPDNLHFNAISLREFGLRYFAKFKDNNKIIFASQTAPSGIRMTEMERL